MHRTTMECNPYGMDDVHLKQLVMQNWSLAPIASRLALTWSYLQILPIDLS